MPVTVIKVIGMKAKANDSRSQTGDTNTSTRKISPLINCFVFGKNSPACRINTNLQGNFNMSCNFWNGFLAKCFETQNLWNLKSPIITTAPAWAPSLLYRLDCQGGIRITNTYFRQQPANQRRDSDCLQYLKSDIVIYKTLSMNRWYII
jgi:hypothetical protein